jgi:hypothetical protein
MLSLMNKSWEMTARTKTTSSPMMTTLPQRLRGRQPAITFTSSATPKLIAPRLPMVTIEILTMRRK